MHSLKRNCFLTSNHSSFYFLFSHNIGRYVGYIHTIEASEPTHIVGSCNTVKSSHLWVYHKVLLCRNMAQGGSVYHVLNLQFPQMKYKSFKDRKEITVASSISGRLHVNCTVMPVTHICLKSESWKEYRSET